MIDKKYVTTRREPFYELARRVIAPSSKVLDIGAGNGDFAAYCNRPDFHLLDGNPESVRVLQKSYANAVWGELPSIPFPDSFFSVVHCSHVIEHLQPQTLYETLKEMDRVLAIGGFLIVSTPLLTLNFYNDLSHIKPYSQVVLLKYLCAGESEGFSRTRPPVSTGYVLHELQFRYAETYPLQSWYNTRRNIIVWAMLKIFSLLSRLGLRRIEKTGYTLVLKKTGNTARNAAGVNGVSPER